MKHLKYLILLAFISAISFMNAQTTPPVFTNNIEKEIINYTDSTADLIRKGRSLLLERLQADDFQKVKEIKDYLKNQVENRDYMALFPLEHWILLYWTREYVDLLNTIKNPDAFEYVHVRRIKPQEDILYDRLREKSLKSFDKLSYNVQSSDLPSVDKDFLVLYLNAILSGNESGITQEKLNDLSDEFLTKHPDSEYEDYVRSTFRYVYKPSKWGFAYEFFTGYGVNNNQLSDRFRNNIPIGIAFDVQYKDFVLYLRDYIGFSKLKKDIFYPDGVWQEKSQVRVFIPEATLGYVLRDESRLKVAPFAGIGAVIYSPTENDVKSEPFLRDADFGSFSYIAGLNLDIKLGQKKDILALNKDAGYGFIRIRYGYCLPRFSKKHSDMMGNMHYITIGIGAFGRRIKRDR